MKRLLMWRAMGTLVLLTAATGLPAARAEAMSFTPPVGNGAPSTSTGGASRGAFMPPTDNTAPRQATGGASRGTFVPPSGNPAPGQTNGGASRNGFVPPSPNSAPRTAASGASRTSLSGYLPAQLGGQVASMLAVTPQNSYGTTLTERPTILVYVPASSAQDAVFSLKDEAGNTIYQTLVAVPETAGVVAIQLPEDAPVLEIDKNYQWFFALLVDGNLSPSTPYVNAWIRRIAPSASLSQVLRQQNSHQQAETLAAHGVWYDSVAVLTQLRMVQPTHTPLIEDWVELLNSVGLQEITRTDAGAIRTSEAIAP